MTVWRIRWRLIGWPRYKTCHTRRPARRRLSFCGAGATGHAGARQTCERRIAFCHRHGIRAVHIEQRRSPGRQPPPPSHAPPSQPAQAGSLRHCSVRYTVCARLRDRVQPSLPRGSAPPERGAGGEGRRREPQVLRVRAVEIERGRAWCHQAGGTPPVGRGGTAAEQL